MIATPDRTPLPGESSGCPVPEAAPGLLGRIPVRGTPDGPIALRPTGTGACDGRSDPGSHTRRSRAARNHVMSGAPGRVRVRFTRSTSGRTA
ncbi:DNA-3-methyladenine glycosylase [Streptomyces caelestis]|uniref:DNA-3-methyladenine glycosylase n=1 Tax=Streptomyces caelestis TaxID=36816 RepID=UPI003656D43B